MIPRQSSLSRSTVFPSSPFVGDSECHQVYSPASMWINGIRFVSWNRSRWSQYKKTAGSIFPRFFLFTCKITWSHVYIITMKISKSTIVLLVFVLMLSIFVANVADLISVDSRLPDETLRDNNGEIRWSRPKYYDIGKSYDHLIWFLQVCPYLYLE